MLSTFPNDYDPLHGLRRVVKITTEGQVFTEEPEHVGANAAQIRQDAEWQRLLNTPPPAPSPRFYQLLDELRALHDAKAHDYAPGEDRFKNFRQCEAMGIPAHEGVVVRMTDKMSRITNLIKRGKAGDSPAVLDESLVDTFRDVACYALIAIELFEQSRG